MRKQQNKLSRIQQKPNYHPECKEISNKNKLNQLWLNNKKQKEFIQNQKLIESLQIFIDYTDNFKKDFKEKENKTKLQLLNNLISVIILVHDQKLLSKELNNFRMKNNLIKQNKISERFFNQSLLQLQLLNLISRFKKEDNKCKKKENSKNKKDQKMRSAKKLINN